MGLDETAMPLGHRGREAESEQLKARPASFANRPSQSGARSPARGKATFTASPAAQRVPRRKPHCSLRSGSSENGPSGVRTNSLLIFSMPS